MSQSCTTEQKDVLLDFLLEHKYLARGLLRRADGRPRAKRLWEEITQKLNSLGGSIKTVKQWQKVWIDLKYLTKKNIAAIRRYTETGIGPPPASLTQSELRVLNIIGERFHGPQTTAPAPVPAFPAINIDEEVAQYKLPTEVLTQPEVVLSNEGSVSVGSSGNLSSISISGPSVKISSLPEALSSQSVQNEPQQQNRQSNPASSRAIKRPFRRLKSDCSAQESNIIDRVLRMERQKMNVLRNIHLRLSGIEKAILELVTLKQNTNC